MCGGELVVYNLLDCILLVEIYIVRVFLYHNVGQILVIEQEFLSFVPRSILVVVQLLPNDHVLEVHVSVLHRDSLFFLLVVLIFVPRHDLFNDLILESVEVSEGGQLKAFNFLV